ncbi:HNH endonuclease [Deinococcus navajonensis]|uniref:HNH endonuclease n=1 Tax=Deinococcus navajonensis TaxID=309884 RepID=A0ABV8XR16_9DEIO
MTRVLIHRYDNEPDILAVETRLYSDVYKRAPDDDFQLVAVVPTLKARTTVAMVAEAAGPQSAPSAGPPWPGRPDEYMVRVPLRNVRRTTLNHVRNAVMAAGETWAAQWTVRIFELDEQLLFGLPPEREPARPDEVSEEETYPEGAVRRVLVNAYERSATARRRCVEHYGATCFICRLDFEKAYGSVAAGFIHVHHLKPLSEIGAAYTLHPVKDLRPVCPNCHAVLHMRRPAFSIDDVREMRRQAAG